MTTPSITFAQAVADWLIALENRNKKLSPNTLTTFRSRVKRLLPRDQQRAA